MSKSFGPSAKMLGCRADILDGASFHHFSRVTWLKP